MKIYGHTVLVADNVRISEIEEKFTDVDIQEYDQIFLREFEDETEFPGLKEPFESQLKKLAILNHIYSRDIELTIKHGQSHSLFEQLWNGKFKDELTGKDFLKLYDDANSSYRNALRKLYVDDIKRLEIIHPSGRNIIESYDDAEQRFLDLKQKREYRFVTHPI